MLRSLEPAALTLVLVFARFLGLFLTLPLLAYRAFPLQLRTAPVLALTLAIAPAVLPNAPQSADVGLLQVAIELAIGGVAGLSLRLAMLSVDLLAESLSLLSGFSFAQSFAPDAALPSTVLGQLLGMAVLSVLLIGDVHLLFIERIAASFASVPIGVWPSGWTMAGVLGLVGGAYSVGLVMACGSFALYLFANFMLGLINRISPQLNLMSVGFSILAPLVLVVLTLVALQLPVLSDLIIRAALDFVDQGLPRAR